MFQTTDDSEYHFIMLKEDWGKCTEAFPFFSLGKHWEIKVCYPSGGVEARLLVRHKKFPDVFCSVYLDCFNKLGHYLNREPYFEVYPAKRDKHSGKLVSQRCMASDLKRLKLLINNSIKLQTENFGRNACKLKS